MIVWGGDRVDMLVAKAGVLESDKRVFTIRIRRHDRHLLTTNNGCVGLNICPDKDIVVMKSEYVILIIPFD